MRRLVSKGTRPRLPWARRLREFQNDPRPVLELLELLKDDPELYVRRSVANNLNDIGKDNPALLVDIARRWMNDATNERRWLISHALRSALKRAEPGAFEVMGFGEEAQVRIGSVRITPQSAVIGGSVKIAFGITNTDERAHHMLVDLKSVSLAEMTTRKHYAGTHKISAVLNGRPEPLGTFELAQR